MADACRRLYLHFLLGAVSRALWRMEGAIFSSPARCPRASVRDIMNSATAQGLGRSREFLDTSFWHVRNLLTTLRYPQSRLLF